MYSDSAYGPVPTYTISVPLVVAVVIGDYTKCSLPSLKEATKDYQNIIATFNGIRDYHIVYLNDQNKLQHLNYQTAKSSTNDTKSWKFKTKWTCDEIEAFNENVRVNIIESQKNDCNFSDNYDSIIYILSCHGDRDECIYDSNGESINTAFILETFNNVKCKQLRQKPKLYFFDTNRISASTLSTSSNVSSENKNNTDMKQQEKNQTPIFKDSQHSRHNENNVLSSPISKPTTMNVSNKTLLQTYTKENHCRKIFGNTAEFAQLQFSSRSVKIGDVGGILVNSLCTTVSCNEIFFKNDFDDILIDIRYQMAKLVGLSENVDLVALIDHNRMPYKIRFGNKDQDIQNTQLKHKELNQFANIEAMQQTV